VFLFISSFFFTVATLTEVVYNLMQKEPVIALILKSIYLIGMIFFAVIALFCYFFYVAESGRSPRGASENELKLYETTMNNVLFTAIIFLAIAGLCSLFTQPGEFANWIHESPASSKFIAIGFSAFIYAIILKKEMRNIERKHLSGQTD
jgi:ABC-type uncharacterized transport system permease subunit